MTTLVQVSVMGVKKMLGVFRYSRVPSADECIRVPESESLYKVVLVEHNVLTNYGHDPICALVIVENMGKR